MLRAPQPTRPTHRRTLTELRALTLVLAVGAAALPLACGRKGNPTGRKQPPPDPGGVRCTLPADELADLGKHDDIAEVPIEERAIWEGLLVERCQGWPPLIGRLMGHLARPPELSGGVPGRGQPPPVYAADRQDMHDRLARLCPAYPTLRKSGDEGLSAAYYHRLYARCGWGALGLMSERIFVVNRPSSLLQVVMFDALLRGGVAVRPARLLVQIWSPFDDWRELLEQEQLSLPVTTSQTASVDAVDVVLSQRRLLVRNRPVARISAGQVEANAKRDGPDGYFIDPLYRELHQAARRMRAAAEQGGSPFRGDLLLLADRRTPYRLLAEVLYTATQAGFSRFQLLGTHAEHRYRAVLVETPRLARGASED